MPPPQTPTRRRDLEIAKRQFTFLVSITATIFILCPECLRIYRNLCIVPALAWLTGFAFDLINSLSNTWDNAPAVLKYFIPVDMNVPITAPFDQISTYVGPTLSWATSRARLMALEAKARIMALRQVVLLVLANWFLHQLGLGESVGGESEDGAQGPSPISDRWYGILVMTPPVHDYGSLPLAAHTSERSQPIPWDSHETSSLPSIFPPSDFRVHLSFCLVPKTVWESQDTTVAEKLKAGLYWDMRGENCGSDGEIWAQARVQRITGIEILGLVDEDQDDVNSCHAYFAALRQDWNYMKISWNDVDFAIILGFLVTGPQAAQRTKNLFIRFSRLRINYLVGRGNVVRATPGVATALTAGLAAAIVGPLFVAGWASAMGSGVDRHGISARDAAMWKRRIEWCQDIQHRFPRLEEFFEE
ncbi:hypothetical protein NCS57_00459600 [Fusarium keratoplasticum]|uniref:Uncharacterized protein n=1 Tax=Fusarium keratoplasticum TaxID=1328300 RepID=A0ACC0R5G7_9HYPO|nr:hypothetical protein NCS57_00459600 [Fusarium keratoplasticum]KAI8675580.1 hypothetical protein NCS57_00459600 [Fusarium keratoplasticum]KAI8682044.1 hypothetical protein NCS55_00458700 [Fusarium keratoplasticum]